jgi:hypothetical protein
MYPGNSIAATTGTRYVETGAQIYVQTVAGSLTNNGINIGVDNVYFMPISGTSKNYGQSDIVRREATYGVADVGRVNQLYQSIEYSSGGPFTLDYGAPKYIYVRAGVTTPTITLPSALTLSVGWCTTICNRLSNITIKDNAGTTLTTTTTGYDYNIKCVVTNISTAAGVWYITKQLTLYEQGTSDGNTTLQITNGGTGVSTAPTNG